MIRTYEAKDLEQVIAVLERSRSELALQIKHQLLQYKTEEGMELFVYEKSEVQGVGILKLDPWKQCGRVEVLVEDEADMYVGAQLDDELTSYVKHFGFSQMVAQIHGVNRGTYEFYETLGYEYWFGYYEMTYSGDVQHTPTLRFKPYDETYFEKYVALQNEGFYQLRKENDIKPYACCEANEHMKEMFSSMQDQIFICVDESDEIICTFSENNGHLDDIVVSKPYKNIGYGRLTTLAAIHHAQNKGAQHIHLDVVIWNQKARHIYEKLGFNITETVVFFRKFI